MRVLFSTSNWMGHYFCMVPLGWALEAAGHEVRVACAPAQSDAVSQTGLIPVPILDSLDTMYMARMMRYHEISQGDQTVPGPLLHPVTGEPVGSLDEFDIAAAMPEFWASSIASMQHSMDAIVEFTRAWHPDLVVHDLLNDDGALAARVADVPAVVFGPGLMGSMEDHDDLALGPGDPTGSFARHGVGTWTREDIEYFIDPSPPCGLPPIGKAMRIPVRYVPYNGPGPMPEWTLRPRNRKQICVLWGNGTSGTFGNDVPSLRHAIDAGVELGADVILTANAEQVAALGPLPDTVRVLRSFPLHLILKVSDVTVHPASSNGVMAAAVAGVPQLTLPLRAESLFIGPRIARSGAAISLPGATADATEIRTALAALLDDPGYTTAAAELRDELLRYPTPADLVGPLERLAREGSFTGLSR